MTERHAAEFTAGLTAVSTTLVRMGVVDIRYGYDRDVAGVSWYLTASTSDGRRATGRGTSGALPGVAILEAGASVIKQLDNPPNDPPERLSSSCGRMCRVTPCEACPERRR